MTLDARPRDDRGTVILHGKGDIDAAVAPPSGRGFPRSSPEPGPSSSTSPL